jgi:hypothetical protein
LVTAFTSVSKTTQDLPWGVSFSMNLFIRCAAAPFDRRARSWTVFQTSAIPVQCVSATNCASFESQCSLDYSTECSGWNPTLEQGYYLP